MSYFDDISQGVGAIAADAPAPRSAPAPMVDDPEYQASRRASVIGSRAVYPGVRALSVTGKRPPFIMSGVRPGRPPLGATPEDCRREAAVGIERAKVARDKAQTKFNQTHSDADFKALEKARGAVAIATANALAALSKCPSPFGKKPPAAPVGSGKGSPSGNKTYPIGGYRKTPVQGGVAPVTSGYGSVSSPTAPIGIATAAGPAPRDELDLDAMEDQLMPDPGPEAEAAKGQTLQQMQADKAAAIAAKKTKMSTVALLVGGAAIALLFVMKKGKKR